MFGTGKIFESREIPFEELALRYLEPKDYQFPEEYLEAYVKTIARLEKAFDREAKKVAE